MAKDKPKQVSDDHVAFRSVAGTAHHCDVSEKTVRRWIAAGDLPVHRFGRALRISEKDLEMFIRTRRDA